MHIKDKLIIDIENRTASLIATDLTIKLTPTVAKLLNTFYIDSRHTLDAIDLIQAIYGITEGFVDYYGRLLNMVHYTNKVLKEFNLKIVSVGRNLRTIKEIEE